jgi:hypothetical protein
MLRIAPTKVHTDFPLENEDFWLKESIWKTLNKKGRAIFNPAFSV